MTNRLQAMFDKLPPHSLESEMVYLGCTMTDLSQLDRTAHIIGTPEAFYSEAHQVIYGVLCEVADHRTQPDLTYIDQQLRKTGRDYGGLDYLLNLAQSAAHLAMAETHAKTIRRLWKTRRLIDAMGTAAFEAYRDELEPEQIIDTLSDSLTAIVSHNDDDKIVDAGDVASAIARRIRTGEQDRTLPTGFPKIDRWFRGGVRPGEVCVIGGRPAQGKTALGLNILEAAAKAGHRVALVSAEMSPEGIVRRMMGPSINSGDPEIAYYNAKQQAERIRRLGIPIVNLTSGSLGEMRRHVRTLVRTKGIEAVAVDYLQLLHTDQPAKEYERISTASVAIKRMAREFDIAVFNLAQINRDGGRRERPSMSDLKGSGQIEQDADSVILIHNPIAVGDQDDPPELIVAKQRNGPTGSVLVDFIPEQTRFVEIPYRPKAEASDLPV